MPIWTYECPRCSHQMDRQFRDVGEADTTEVWCPECEPDSYPNNVNLMRRLPAAPNFTVRGFSAKNGYGSAQ